MVQADSLTLLLQTNGAQTMPPPFPSRAQSQTLFKATGIKLFFTSDEGVDELLAWSGVVYGSETIKHIHLPCSLLLAFELQLPFQCILCLRQETVFVEHRCAST